MTEHHVGRRVPLIDYRQVARLLVLGFRGGKRPEVRVGWGGEGMLSCSMLYRKGRAVPAKSFSVVLALSHRIWYA
jgi:hypothetical protein